MSRAAARTPRLLQTVPRIYVGPDAGRSLRGEKGVLLGSKRPQWVDVLDFDAQPDARVSVLVERRFAAYERWEVVGLSLPAAELHALRDRLLNELVPGDILITETGPSVHLGDAWAKATFAR